MTESIYKLGPVIILDIEGTTTSISFVKEVLFPYARSNLGSFLVESWDDPEVVQIIELIGDQYRKDLEAGISDAPKVVSGDSGERQAVISSLVENLLWQMDHDRKTTGLKALQGKIWKSGYEDGLLTSHIFPDVIKALAQWTEDFKKIYIYSSGSVDAQKLLFRHTEHGSLLHYFSGYFDTTIGAKVESQSYQSIAAQINEIPHNITFFTDSLQEADAAREAGMRVVVMVRPGNPDVDIDPCKYSVATSFDNFI